MTPETPETVAILVLLDYVGFLYDELADFDAAQESQSLFYWIM